MFKHKFTRGDRDNSKRNWKVASCPYCGLSVKSIEAVELKNGAIVLFKCPHPDCAKFFAKEYLEIRTWEVRDVVLSLEDFNEMDRILRNEGETHEEQSSV